MTTTTHDQTDQELKVEENRLRRAAERQGLKLEKARVRDPRAIGYGTYQLTNLNTGVLESHGLQSGYGLSLDDVASQLSLGSTLLKTFSAGYYLSIEDLKQVIAEAQKMIEQLKKEGYVEE